MQTTKQRVLCIDDSEDTGWMLSIMLGHAGYDVRWATSLEAGLSYARVEHFDLYILDNIFPDGTGTELYGSIRELHHTTPIIFFSGLAHESDRRSILDLGAQDYLVKPNDLGRLIKTVQRLTGDGDGHVKQKAMPLSGHISGSLTPPTFRGAMSNPTNFTKSSHN